MKKELQTAIEGVEEKLSKISPQIHRALNLKGRHWAIVGGFVRDLIISLYYKVDVPSPDVDIALIGCYPKYKKNDHISTMQKNTFGGLKIISSTFGEIDLWTLNSRGRENVPKLERRRFSTTLKVNDSYRRRHIVLWEKYLRDIDFNANTVLYAYPEKKIIINKEKWLSFLEYQNIEINNTRSPYPYLQPIRALALAEKLSSLTSQEFRISDKLKCSLREYGYKQDRIINDYIEKKIKCQKWEDRVLSSYALFLKNAHKG